MADNTPGAEGRTGTGRGVKGGPSSPGVRMPGAPLPMWLRLRVWLPQAPSSPAGRHPTWALGPDVGREEDGPDPEDRPRLTPGWGGVCGQPGEKGGCRWSPGGRWEGATWWPGAELPCACSTREGVAVGVGGCPKLPALSAQNRQEPQRHREGGRGAGVQRKGAVDQAEGFGMQRRLWWLESGGLGELCLGRCGVAM